MEELIKNSLNKLIHYTKLKNAIVVLLQDLLMLILFLYHTSLIYFLHIFALYFIFKSHLYGENIEIIKVHTTPADIY